jgi:hypothetical protein
MPDKLLNLHRHAEEAFDADQPLRVPAIGNEGADVKALRDRAACRDRETPRGEIPTKAPDMRQSDRPSDDPLLTRLSLSPGAIEERQKTVMKQIKAK